MRTIAFWLLFISQGLFTLSAQSYTFSGIITNEKRKMMDGVQVILSVEDSLSAMALTDEKGHFRIDGLKEGAYELRLFFLGYNAQEQILRVENRDVRKDFLLTLAFFSSKKSERCFRILITPSRSFPQRFATLFIRMLSAYVLFFSTKGDHPDAIFRLSSWIILSPCLYLSSDDSNLEKPLYSLKRFISFV